jgi:hypothetical protein
MNAKRSNGFLNFLKNSKKGNKMIKLGTKVRDKITGFEGIATSRTEFLYGCIRIGVTPKMDKDGRLGDVQHFDEPQLEELLNEEKISTGNRTIGGPMNSIPTRNDVPKR